MEEEKQMPSTTVHHEHSIIPFEWMLKKVLGPTFESLGNDIRAGYEKTKKRIFSSAAKKLKPSQEQGKANLRVAWDILSQASFTESEIGAEYFGGILAASKTEDGQDDTGIYYLNIAKTISSKQLYLHYIVYISLNKLLIAQPRKDLNVGMGSEVAKINLYFSADELRGLGIKLETDFFALTSVDLIMPNWEVGLREVIHPATQEKVQIYCAQCSPTPLGIQMLAIAQNKLQDYDTFSTAEFETFPDINLPTLFTFSAEELLDITKVQK